MFITAVCVLFVCFFFGFVFFVESSDWFIALILLVAMVGA